MVDNFIQRRDAVRAGIRKRRYDHVLADEQREREHQSDLKRMGSLAVKMSTKQRAVIPGRLRIDF